MKTTTPIKSASPSGNEEEKKSKSPAILTAETSLLSQEAAVLAEASTKTQSENERFDPPH